MKYPRQFGMRCSWSIDSIVYRRYQHEGLEYHLYEKKGILS